MPHYILSFCGEWGMEGASSLEIAAAALRAGFWRISKGERNGSALAPGDLVLVYLGPPVREFIGRAAVASSVLDLAPTVAEPLTGQPASGVLLSDMEEWDPPVTMTDVLRCIDPSQGAKAEIPPGVVRITEPEYQGALAAASARRTHRTGDQ